MHVLVTGGAGYVGSHILYVLQQRGHTAVALDSMEAGFHAAVGDTPLVIGNTNDAGLLDRVFGEQRFDAVIHCAAYKAPGESFEQPGRYFANNVGGSLTLFDAMARADIKTLVFSSTCAVYGTPATVPVLETHPLQPESPYGESKLMVEQMLRWFDARYGLRSVCLRYFNVAGAVPQAGIGEDARCTFNLLPTLMHRALGPHPAVSIFGVDYPTPDGTLIRDYIHVLDLADAHERALHFIATNDRSAVFNLGTGSGYSVRQVIDTVKRISGVAIEVTEGKRRAGDLGATYADNAKAKAELGWQPTRTLNDMITSAWDWHVAHPHGYAT